MKSFFGLLFFVVLIFPALAAEVEEAPRSINAHYSWCGRGKTVAEKLKRYEGFWKERMPEDGEYDDHPHVTYVRRCAYRLAGLYAQTGEKAKCQKLLQWLEKTDDSLPENEKEPGKK